MHAGKAEKPGGTETSECMKTKTRAGEERRGQEVLFKTTVQAEIIPVLPSQMFWLVGRRSKESQRVPGWSRW